MREDLASLLAGKLKDLTSTENESSSSYISDNVRYIHLFTIFDVNNPK